MKEINQESNYDRPFKLLLKEFAKNVANYFNLFSVRIYLLSNQKGRDDVTFKNYITFRNQQINDHANKVVKNNIREVLKSGKVIKIQGKSNLRKHNIEQIGINSFLFVPIKMRWIKDGIEKILGVIVLFRKINKYFTYQDIEIMKIAANILALGIWNYKYEVGGSTIDDFEYKGYGLLNINFHDAVNVGLKKILVLLKADIGTIYRYDNSTRKFFNPIAHGVSEKFWNHAIPRTGGVAEHVINYKKPRFIENILQEPLLYNSPFANEEHVKSEIVASLSGEGVIFINYKKSRKFTNQMKQQLNIFVKLLSAIYYSISVVEKTKWEKEESEEIKEWIKAISQFLRKKMVEFLNVDILTLYNYNDNNNVFELLLVEGKKPPSIQGRPVVDGIVDKYGKQNKAQFYNSIEGTEIEKTPFAINEKIKSVAILPLICGKKDKIGVLFINYRTPHEFDLKQQELLKSFSDLLTLLLRSITRSTIPSRTIQVLRRIHGYRLDEKTYDFQHILQTIIDGIYYLIKADLLIILIYRKDKQNFEIGGLHGIEKSFINNLLPARNLIARKVIKERQETQIDDLREFDKDNPLCKIGIKTLRCVPLYYSNEIVGILEIGFLEKGYKIPKNELELMKVLYGEAAQRIYNFLTKNKIKQKQHQLEALLEITKKIHTSRMELERNMNKITEMIACTLGYRRCIVSIRIKEGFESYFKRIAFCGIPNENIEILSAKSNWNRVKDVQKIMKKDFQISNSYYIRDANIKELEKTVTSYCPAETNEKRKEWQWHQNDLLITPLKKGDDLIGLLSVDEPYDLNLPSENSVKSLEIFAEHLVLALDNVNRYQRRIRELNTLKSIDEEIISNIAEVDGAFGLNAVLNSIIAKSKVIENVDNAEIYLIGGDILKREVKYSKIEYNDSAGESITLDAKRSIVALTAREGRYKLVHDVCSNDWKNIYLNTYPGIRSELAVPLKKVDEILGVINVESTEISAFNDEDRNYLEALAAQSVITIQNARTLEKREKHLNEYKLLSNIEKMIGSSLETKEIVIHILNTIVECVPLKLGNICQWDEINKELKFLATHRVSSQVKDKTYNYGISILSAIQKRTIYIEDLDRECSCCKTGSWRSNHFYPLDSIEMKSELVVPIRFQNRILGIINMESDTEDAFKEYIPLVEFIAERVSHTIAKAEQHKEIIIEEEARVKRDLWAFIAQTMMHEVKKNIVTLRGNFKLLESAKKDGNWNDILKENKEIIQNMLFDLKRLPSETKLQRYDIKDVLNPLTKGIRRFKEYNDGIKIATHFTEKQAIVDANKNCIRLILRNVFQNACEAMLSGGTLTIKSDVIQDRVEILIEDTGIGIKAETKKKLFHEVIKSKKGMGIFLIISKSLINSFNGDIILVKSLPNKGTCFKIWLPLS